MNRTKHQLTAEVAARRSKVEDLKRDLLLATGLYKRSRLDTDGARVADFESRVRLAELALEGATEELAAKDRPPIIEICASRDELVRQRDQLIQSRDYRHRQYEQQVQLERQACGFRDPDHIATHLRNVFGSGEVSRRRSDEQDQHRIDHYNAQIALIDERSATTHTAA